MTAMSDDKHTEELARALYDAYRARTPGLLTWENDSKADEFRAEAKRLIPHLAAVVATIRADAEAAGVDRAAEHLVLNDQFTMRTLDLLEGLAAEIRARSTEGEPA